MAVAEGATQTDAYRQNYTTEGWAAQRVTEAASRTAAVPNVSARIRELTAAKQTVAKDEFDMTVRRLLLTFIEIAFTDPNELISVRSGACRHCWGLEGLFQWKEHEFAQALAKWQKEHERWLVASPSRRGEEPEMPDGSGGFGYRFTADANPHCIQCEGEGLERMVPKDTTKLSSGARHLYRGAQQTKDGIKILFADKDGALDKIGRILGAYDDRLRVDLKADITALSITTNDPQEAAAAYEKMLTARSN